MEKLEKEAGGRERASFHLISSNSGSDSDSDSYLNSTFLAGALVMRFKVTSFSSLQSKTFPDTQGATSEETLLRVRRQNFKLSSLEKSIISSNTSHNNQTAKASAKLLQI